ncbi:hypothetical protein EDB83DRAFT_2350875, partial [Lactarius deliciosus]
VRRDRLDVVRVPIAGVLLICGASLAVAELGAVSILAAAGSMVVLQVKGSDLRLCGSVADVMYFAAQSAQG